MYAKWECRLITWSPSKRISMPGKRLMLLLGFVCVWLSVWTGRAHGAAVQAPGPQQPSSAGTMTSMQHRQLLEGFAGGTLSDESLKQKTRQYAIKKGAAEKWKETTTVIVPSGDGRMLILESPASARFKVVLSASPKTYLTSGGPTPFLPDPISAWPTDGQCNRYGLLAAAFRRDRVPEAVTRMANPAVRFARRRTGSRDDHNLLTRLTHGCDRSSAQDLNKTAAAEDEKRQRWVGNITYNLPEGTVDALLTVNRTKPSRNDALGSVMPEGYKQLVGWPKRGTKFAPTPSLQALSTSSSLATCERQREELQTTNVTLPGFNGATSRTECGTETVSQIVVYVHNCFTDGFTDMLVRVSIDTEKREGGICETNMLWTVQVMCVSGIFMMALVAGACILPELLVAGFAKASRMYDKYKRAQAKKNKKKGNAQAAISPPAQDRHVKFESEAPAPFIEGTGDVAELYRMFHDTLSNLNNPSGYSRLYTVAITTSVALLVAAIVWAPSIQPSAVHDSAFSDIIIIIPRKGELTWKEESKLIQDALYYLKVMGLSALMGHTVKLALLSNLSPPAPGSKGVVVSPAVWWRQVVLSVVGLLLLAFVIGSYTVSFLVLNNALEILPAHWYLLVVMLANFVTAVGFYIHHTFRCPPPLTSEAANSAASGSRSPPQPPSSLSLKAAASFRMRSLKGRSVQMSPSMPPASSPIPEATAAKDTAGSPDQATADGSAGSERGVGEDCEPQGPLGGKGQKSTAKEPKPTLAQRGEALQQRIGSVSSSLAAKIRGDIWEDENFRYSSWVLTPVWLTILLVVFWWITGVCRTGLVVDCLQDPATCSGGVIPFTTPVSELQMQVQDLLSSGKEAARIAQQTALLLNANLDSIKEKVGPDGANFTRLLKWVEKFDTVLDNSTRDAKKAADGLDAVQAVAKNALYKAEQAGRWLGYTTAVLFALLSLYQIVKTFKRVLLFQVYMRKSPVEQDDMVDTLANRQSTGARMLARVMSTLRPASSSNEDPIQELRQSGNSNESERSSPFESDPDLPSSRMRHRGSFSGCHTVIMPMRTLHMPEHALSGKAHTVHGLPSSSKSPQELTAYPLHSTGSSGGGRVQQLHRSDLVIGHVKDALGFTNSLETLKRDQEDSLCVSIAQDIQRLEVDMARFGIGASTALLSVMASVMWIQIRIIGLALTLVFTLICHPVVWRVTWESRLWVPVVTLLVIVLFNMFVVKRLIGSRLLSDGTNIRHRGSWMTFYLMFQFTYMVLGTLYATWRVVLAIVSIMLFAVAALDRCLMGFLTLLDGPYISFVASVKLEGAYLAISQRDVEAEAEADILRKMQEELEEEEEDEERESEKGESGEHGKGQGQESVQQEQQGLGKKLSQVEKGEAGKQE